MTYICIAVSVIATIVSLVLVLGLRIDREYERGIIFRLGDQQRHPVFVRIEQGRIRDVLAEDEFEKLGVAVFIRDL